MSKQGHWGNGCCPLQRPCVPGTRHGVSGRKNSLGEGGSFRLRSTVCKEGSLLRCPPFLPLRSLQAAPCPQPSAEWAQEQVGPPRFGAERLELVGAADVVCITVTWHGPLGGVTAKPGACGSEDRAEPHTVDLGRLPSPLRASGSSALKQAPEEAWGPFSTSSSLPAGEGYVHLAFPEHRDLILCTFFPSPLP